MAAPQRESFDPLPMQPVSTMGRRTAPAALATAGPPALSSTPDAIALLRALKRRWVLAFVLGVAFAGIAGAAAYVVSKSGLAALIRALALELKESGVTVNGILPRTIDTPENRRNMPESDPTEWARPESIAQVLMFLASDESDQISGALVPVGA